MPSTLTIPVGSSMADAERQLVVRTFAMAHGDVERAARLLGRDTEDVPKGLLTLINGVADPGWAASVRRPTPAATAPATGAPSARAKPAKKR